MLQGKGVWAYREGELERALQIAPSMGATHVIYKVGQGAAYYPRSAQAVQVIEAAGLIPFAWTFLQLDNPQAEAQVVTRALQDGYQGFVFDTEADQCRNRFDQATELGQYLSVAGVDPQVLYNCSFPNISHHRDLPYDQMNVFCQGGLMPMAYGTFFSPDSTLPPEKQAERVIDDWAYGHHAYWSGRWGYSPPLYPVLGPYHDEHANVRMGTEEFQHWVDHVAAHKPSFFSVFTAAVINDDLLPLIDACPLGEPAEAEGRSVLVEVVSPREGYLNVRATPSTESAPVARLDHGTVLEVSEMSDEVMASIGQEGEWVLVRLPDSARGYVAAWYLRLVESEDEEPVVVEPEIRVEVVSPLVGYLNVRPSPSTERPPITRVDDGVVMDALDPDEEVEAKVGRTGEWLRVRTPGGIEGYVAAWYLRIYEEAPADGEPIPYLVVHSSVGLNVRRGPGTDPPIWHVPDRSVLEVDENTKKVAQKVGKDRWIKVRTPSLHEGYVNGLYVRPKRVADRRSPVSDAALPSGESAWIFGIHAAESTRDADFRPLFQGKNKAGWILFTEAIGTGSDQGGHDYSDWAGSGFGVIVRLNHGYEPAGTLPVRAKYPDFAQACASYVRNSQGCHIWIIGNEQNNVREHPGGAANPIEHITPEMYAEAFNLARQHIKQVQPGAIVVPGAVDPHNTFPWAQLGGRRTRPLEYFETMLKHIADLDGIALHAYTHWMDVGLITARTVFGDAFLQPETPKEHYFDFQAYRSFAELIPAKWQNRPIYITETNHWVALEHQPQTPEEEKRLGWVNKNKGWVQAAYAEIQRWNETPHAHQIQCLLLYRWTGDEWAIEGLGEIHKDFRKALNHDYRWRR